jgi:ABC-2 type transport system permease protein
MNMYRIYAVFLRQIYLLRGSLTRFVPLFIWVGIDIVVWGFITKYLNQVGGAAFNFTTLMLGAMLMWGFLVRVMHGVTMAFLEDVWSRNFLNIFSTPITTGEYIAGLVLSSIATSAVGLFVMLLVATTVFGLSFATYGVMLYPFLLALFLFGIALGIFSVSLVLRLGPAAEWFVWPIPAVVSPFVGVLYPLAVLPQWMQSVGHALPPSYVFESMRAVVLGQGEVTSIAMALSLSVVYIVLASWHFARVYRFALKTGLIARYSAESVS